MTYYSKLTAALATCAVLAAGTAMADTYRLAHVLPPNDDIHKGAEIFAAEVAEATGGEVEVTLFPGGQLGGPNDVAEQVRAGIVDMTLIVGGQMMAWVPEFAAVQLPFQFLTFDHAYAVTDGEGSDLLNPLAEEQGFKILAHWPLGFRAISNNKRPINTVEDMAGLKIRVPQELPMDAAMRAAGAIPVQLQFPEVFSALTVGAVDGQENPLRIIYSTGVYKEQDHVAIPGPGYMYVPISLVVSKRVWDGLDDAEKKAMEEAAIKAREWMREQLVRSRETALSEMQAAGIEFTSPDMDEFRAAMEPAWKEISDFAGPDFMAKWHPVVEKHRQ